MLCVLSISPLDNPAKLRLFEQPLTKGTTYGLGYDVRHKAMFLTINGDLVEVRPFEPHPKGLIDTSLCFFCFLLLLLLSIFRSFSELTSRVCTCLCCGAVRFAVWIPTENVAVNVRVGAPFEWNSLIPRKFAIPKIKSPFTAPAHTYGLSCSDSKDAISIGSAAEYGTQRSAFFL